MNWKGGKRINKGYIEIKKWDHPHHQKSSGYIREHRLVMEEKLGRYLKPEEDIHHINKIRTDNRIENLILFKNRSEHRKYEIKNRKRDKKGRFI